MGTGSVVPIGLARLLVLVSNRVSFSPVAVVCIRFDVHRPLLGLVPLDLGRCRYEGALVSHDGPPPGAAVIHATCTLGLLTMCTVPATMSALGGGGGPDD
mmetsp:Transcript_10369/g.25711  ORF Transcript_10369/g.25711 Transcript_10369/m.25711 type:complete len:100 (-) Transcript_10369:296-595(-)